jgi:TolB-like protein/DNA-binding winged helix-turn-helix (wHTH) protein/Flp pilus assembly protein TadD
MDRSLSSPDKVRFGVFELDLRAGELRKQGIKIRLQDQPLLILQALLERPGEIVTHEELKAKIWPEGTFVDFDHGLHSAMKRLRDALGDSADTPRFVETLARRGYRFIAPVELAERSSQAISRPVEAPPPAETAEGEQFSPPRPVGKVLAAGLGALVAIFLICFALNVGGLRNLLLGKTSAKSYRSLAVLPLANFSSDPAQDYFADQMTDELITQFSNLGDLKVISRTSVMRYKGTKMSLPQIARELGVDAIVEGAVQRSGTRVRITAQLVDAATDKHLWAKDYDRDLSDVLLLQSEVARDIAGTIQVQLTPQQQKRLEKEIRPVIPEAYESYLLGRYYWNKRTADGLKKAGDFFQQAIAKDPNYALAYSGLSDYFAFLTLVGGPEIMPPREAMTKAKTAAAKALELDDSLAEAHASMGHVLHNYDWDWAGAEREFKRAIELNPNYSIVHHWYAHELMQLGRVREGLEEARRAKELDPLSLFVNNGLARQYYLSRQNDEAIAQCRKALKIDPGYVPAHIQLGLAFEQKAMFNEAILEFEQAREQAASYALTGEETVSAGNAPPVPAESAIPSRPLALSSGSRRPVTPAVDLPVVHAMLGHAYARSGRRAEAQNELQVLGTLAQTRYVPPSYKAIVYIGLGDKDQAFTWLDQSYQDRSEHMLYLKMEPLVDPLRNDPRFASLLKRVGLQH